MEEEFAKIRKIVNKYSYIAMVRIQSSKVLCCYSYQAGGLTIPSNTSVFYYVKYLVYPQQLHVHDWICFIIRTQSFPV